MPECGRIGHADSFSVNKPAARRSLASARRQICDIVQNSFAAKTSTASAIFVGTMNVKLRRSSLGISVFPFGFFRFSRSAWLKKREARGQAFDELLNCCELVPGWGMHFNAA
jgi:hypothetical protein